MPETLSQVNPVAELEDWTARLRAISRQPLALCPQFPEIARRFEAWWACDVTDRPILIATANSDPSRPITRRIDLIHDADAWLDAKRRDLVQQMRVGDALPVIRVDFGPVMLGALMGGRTEIGADTTWTHTVIDDDWSNAPTSLQEDHPWWRQLGVLLDRVAEDAAGQYVVCTPDLGGSADVLLNLRGSSELCLDVVERPETVRNAIDAIYPAWRRTWIELYRRTVERNAGVVHWLNVWSDKPYMIPACDFNYMISPSHFESLMLPDIARQAATAGRAVFHLDGPGAARHINSLLDVPEIHAIQFTPGEGTPSALAWLDMFRTIQKRGKALYVFTPAREAVELARALRPEGLAICVLDVPSPDALRQLFAEFTRPFGGRCSESPAG